MQGTISIDHEFLQLAEEELARIEGLVGEVVLVGCPPGHNVVVYDASGLMRESIPFSGHRSWNEAWEWARKISKCGYNLKEKTGLGEEDAKLAEYLLTIMN